MDEGRKFGLVLRKKPKIEGLVPKDIDEMVNMLNGPGTPIRIRGNDEYDACGFIVANDPILADKNHYITTYLYTIIHGILMDPEKEHEDHIYEFEYPRQVIQIYMD